MRYNDAIYLIKEETVYDELGIGKKEKSERLVFANKYQVSTSEFYSDNVRHDASTQAIRHKSAFVVRSSDYDNETSFLYDKKEYEIIRVSDLGEFTHIVGGEKIGKR